MVLKHNKRLADDESCQHAYNKRLRRLDHGRQLVSFTDLASYSGMTKELAVSDCKDISGVQGGADVGTSNSVFSFVNMDRKTRNGNFVAHEYHSDCLATSSDHTVRPGLNNSPLFEDKLSHAMFPFVDEDCKYNFWIQGGADVDASNSVFSFADKGRKMRNQSFAANEHYRDLVCAYFSDRLETSSDDTVRPGDNNSPFLEDKLSQPACKFPENDGHNYEQNSLPEAEVHLIESKFGESPTTGAIYKESERHKFYDLFNDSTKTADHKISDLPLVECILNGKAELDLSGLQSNSLLFDDGHRLEDFSQLDLPCPASIDYCSSKPVAIGPNHQAEIPSWRPHESTCSLGNFSQLDLPCTASIDYCPSKPVAIGPNHQAEIPSWRPHESTLSLGSSNCSKGSSEARGESSEIYLGKCVIPSPDPILSTSCFSNPAYCRCEDVGSIKCVKLHIEEARIRLKFTLGQNTYEELGFSDMGEVVSQKWSEAEEQLFLEVVLSNPASLGRNFWNSLPLYLPSRSSKELVSYYFNVFMLRKRTAQNRLDPYNVDSDNDEWQENDGCGEFEEEYDSAVQSPGPAIGTSNDDDQMTGIGEESNDADACEDYTADGKNKDDTFYSSSGHESGCDKDTDHRVEDIDIHDESCTSYEAKHQGAESCGGSTDVPETDYCLEGVHDVPETEYCLEGDHESVDGKCKNVCVTGMGFDGNFDPKFWDTCYINGLNEDMDLHIM